MQTIAQQFFNWLTPSESGLSRYDLYWQFLNKLPHSENFWIKLARKADAMDEHRRPLLHYLFMGAVQYLVLGDSREPLARYFPASSAFDQNLNHANAGIVFEEFIHRRQDEVWNIVQTREVQINKLGRLALFAPLFLEIAGRSAKPLTFVEVGCSVGLGLLWPRYNYHYPGHGKVIVGRPFGELSCPIKGVPSISLKGILPEPSFICGIDPIPLSVDSEEDVRWLLALTAPHDEDGRKNLRAGLEAVAKVKPRIERGCVLDVLPRLESEWMNDDSLVVYHSMTRHHLQDAGKEQSFHHVLSKIAKQRRVFEVGVEWAKQPSSNHQGKKPVEITLCEWKAHGVAVERIGETDLSADGRVIEFR